MFLSETVENILVVVNVVLFVAFPIIVAYCEGRL